MFSNAIYNQNINQEKILRPSLQKLFSKFGLWSNILKITATRGLRESFVDLQIGTDGYWTAETKPRQKFN